MNPLQLYDFIAESNRIEGIERRPTPEEVDEANRFIAFPRLTLPDLLQFVAIYEPSAELRDRPGLNVYVGSHVSPPGDITIRTRLEDILRNAVTEDPYCIHVRYELLHPFTDCNGRSGRMIWLWMMRNAPLGFLHTFYYQALATSRR